MAFCVLKSLIVNRQVQAIEKVRYFTTLKHQNIPGQAQEEHGIFLPEDGEALQSAQIYKLKPESSDEENKLLEGAKECISKLHKYNHYSVICGGWVRDKLMKRPCSDMDIATSANPVQIGKVFKKIARTKQNTVIVFIEGDMLTHKQDDKLRLEVTPFRGEGVFKGFEAARQDAFKRDFTVNSLFYDPIQEQVLDFVGGVKDLENRCLKCPSDPLLIFQTDPIRCFRAVRFAAFYQLQIQKETEEALRQVCQQCSQLHGMDVSRVLREFEKLENLELEKKGTFAAAMKMAKHLGLLKYIVPTKYEDVDFQQDFEQGLRVVSILPQFAPMELMILALFPPDVMLPHRIREFYKLQYHKSREFNMYTMEMLLVYNQLQQVGKQVKDSQWAQFYARRYSEVCSVLHGAWMKYQGNDGAQEMLRFHQANRVRLKELIKTETQVLLADHHMSQRYIKLRAELRQQCLEEVRNLIINRKVSGAEALEIVENDVEKLRPFTHVTRVSGQ